jgi:carboxyl-terminal processing protease
MRGRLGIVMVILLAALLGGGWLMRRGLATPSTTSRLSAAQGQRLLRDVMQRVQASWVDTVGVDEMYRRAALGVLGELGDPNTSYLPPDRFRGLRETTSGSYTGIGVTTDTHDGRLVVTAVRPASPAERAGLRVGDRLVEADGKAMAGWTAEETRNALRGPAGSRLTLTIERIGARIPLQIERSDIHLRSVQRPMILPSGAGYFAISTFSDSTAIETATIVDSLVQAGAKSVVMDLRGNPGGLLTQGVAVAELFLDPGQKILITKGRAAQTSGTFLDKLDQRWPKLPVVVLVNSNTASAAEIVAGALQDHDRATVVGRPSYGKGSAQAVVPLDNGAAIKITNARWYTPSGRSIDRLHLVRNPDGSLPDTTRPTFKTDKGRTVVGGGGIVPDVIAGDSTISAAERAWVASVGAKVRIFRDALTAFAETVAKQGRIKDPTFIVTAEMRDGLWRMMGAKGLDVPRTIFNEASEAIDRVLGNELARVALGANGAATRAVLNDAVVAEAVRQIK